MILKVPMVRSKICKALFLMFVLISIRTLGFITPEKKYIINPEACTKLIPNSKLIVLGKPEEIEKLNQLF